MKMSFDEFFHSIYGERWAGLRQALLHPVQKVWVPGLSADVTVVARPSAISWDHEECLKVHTLPAPEDQPWYYGLDLASLYPVMALDLEPEMSFLDVCSAPGGKALMALLSTGGNLRARLNDLSKDRVKRLKSVLFDFLPEDVVQALTVTASDGSRIGQRQPEEFDRVLVDAPCSGERHALQDGREDRWSEKQSKSLAIRQHALLCSGFDALKPGGRLVYSTCSISPLENDGVIGKIQKSRKGAVRVIETTAALGERTEFGRLILPDRGGHGPIYYAVLQKVPS